MNLDAFTKGIKRATAQRKQQQRKAVSTPIKPAMQQQTAKPAFNYEAYRLDIIAKAVAYISKLKGATQ
ncbi:hypothetical protein [Pseudomonas monteilii]|uniref:hypothetical protein n=1 Tax=Pseudomonas monteilii TaxID=76759 RepID=UPI0012DA60E3|nr:hypothetical protein [Pseudomonas monteilii]